jgi:hypothetical protein
MSSNYKDIPFAYHVKLLQVLYTTAIGKEGMYLNEMKLRTVMNLKEILDILIMKDKMTEGGEADFKDNDDLEDYTNLKTPLLKFVYFTFFESEKISDDFDKYKSDFLLLL